MVRQRMALRAAQAGRARRGRLLPSVERGLDRTTRPVQAPHAPQLAGRTRWQVARRLAPGQQQPRPLLLGVQSAVMPWRPPRRGIPQEPARTGRPASAGPSPPARLRRPVASGQAISPDPGGLRRARVRDLSVPPHRSRSRTLARPVSPGPAHGRGRGGAPSEARTWATAPPSPARCAAAAGSSRVRPGR
jgi:hypothetical protein